MIQEIELLQQAQAEERTMNKGIEAGEMGRLQKLLKKNTICTDSKVKNIGSKITRKILGRRKSCINKKEYSSIKE